MPSATALEVLAAQGLVTVQDAGRPGHMHEGVPPGGYLAEKLAAVANDAVGNPPGAALVEVLGAAEFTAEGAALVMATESGARRTLAPGERLRVAPRPMTRLRYLAVRGGLDVPVVLGGRGTLLGAGFGGHEGRVLRRGDRIPVLASGSIPEEAPAREIRLPFMGEAPIRVIPGPDFARFDASASRVFFGHAFTVLAESDRTGVRLGGPSILRVGPDVQRSTPMVRGAIQIPAGGHPIVLGPDHPTTGGYPVIAVVARIDTSRMFALPVGSKIRFSSVSVDEARRLLTE